MNTTDITDELKKLNEAVIKLNAKEGEIQKAFRKIADCCGFVAYSANCLMKADSKEDRNKKAHGL